LRGVAGRGRGDRVAWLQHASGIAACDSSRRERLLQGTPRRAMAAGRHVAVAALTLPCAGLQAKASEKWPLMLNKVAKAIAIKKKYE